MYLNAIVLVFLICFGNSLTGKDKKTDSDDVFVPSKEWKEIKEGQKVPSGLHYRINLSTGKKEAKIHNANEKQDLESTKSFMLQDSDENGELITADDIETLLKEVNKKNPEKDMPKQFRTLDEIKRDLGDIELHPKSDFEVLRELFHKFEIEEKNKKRDENVILHIVREMKYLGHQIDNGNEFYKMDGFRKIVYKELNSSNTVIKQESLKLFSILAQNNPKVKVHILETGGITTLLRILNLETNANIKESALSALSSTLRTFPYAQNKFVEIGGLAILTELFKTGSIKLKLKIGTLLNDLIVERQKDTKNFEHHKFVDIEKELQVLNWCNHLNELLHDLITVDVNDHDSIEKCLLAMNSMVGHCKGIYESDLILKLHDQYSLLARKSEDESSDYYQYLSDLTSTLVDTNKGSNPRKEEL